MANIIETNLRFNGALSYRTKTNYIVLHHAEATKASVEDIHRWHLNNGWAGIGYNYYIRKDGSVYRGRPCDAVGAHCQGYNSVSVGICAEGNYESESMPAAQWQAILELVSELKKIYPGAQVVGHKELNATACPGQNYPLEEIKAGRGPVESEDDIMALEGWQVVEGQKALQSLADKGLVKNPEVWAKEKELAKNIPGWLFWVMLNRIVDYKGGENKNA